MEVQPFLGVGVPMQFPEAAGLERNKRGGEGLASGKVGRVNLVELTTFARNGLGLVLKRSVHERRVTGELPSWAIGHVLGAHGAVENVGVRLGDVIKNGGVNTKVFGDNIAGGMSDPVVDVERRAMMGSVVRNLLAVLGSLPDFVKIGVIKDQEKLVLIAQALHSMCHALGEIPNVTIVERLNLISSELVDSRN